MKELSEENLKKWMSDLEMHQPSPDFTTRVMQEVQMPAASKTIYKPLLSRRILFTIYGIYIFTIFLCILLGDEAFSIQPSSGDALLTFIYTGIRFLSMPGWFYTSLKVAAIAMLLDTFIYIFIRKRVRQALDM